MDFRAVHMSICSTLPMYRRAGQTINGELNIALDRTDFLVVFPLKGEGRARFIGTVREEEIRRKGEEMTWRDVARGWSSGSARRWRR